jgi:hypothetical protein
VVALAVALALASALLAACGGQSSTPSESLRTQLIVALDPASTIRSGSKAELWFDTERMHVFDPATGENLTRNRDRPSDDQAAGVGVAGPPTETGSS